MINEMILRRVIREELRSFQTDENLPPAASTPTPSPSDPYLVEQLRVENKKLGEQVRVLERALMDVEIITEDRGILLVARRALAALASTKEGK